MSRARAKSPRIVRRMTTASARGREQREGAQGGDQPLVVGSACALRLRERELNS